MSSAKKTSAKKTEAKPAPAAPEIKEPAVVEPSAPLPPPDLPPTLEEAKASKTVPTHEQAPDISHLAQIAAQIDIEGIIARTVRTRPGCTYFVSVRPEPATYNMLVAGTNIVPAKSKEDGRLVFCCPSDIAHRFRAHSFVTSGRLIEAANTDVVEE